jgi:hypothetical protein
MNTYVHLWQYLARFLLKWKMLQTKVVEEMKTHFMFSNFFFSFENRAVCEIMWRNIVERGQATDDNMAHAHCMLDTEGYKHALKICNTYSFSTATVVAGTRLTVT